jgi:TolA-binding protein
MTKHHITLAGAAAIAIAVAAPVALAQDATVAKRVDKLEKEMRAVQRQVFPGGAPAFFEGEIAPDATPGQVVKSNSPVADLTARVDALESQLRALTGQTEQNAFQLRELEKQFAAYKAEMDKRVPPAAAGEPAATPASLPVVAAPRPAAPTPAPAATATPPKKPATPSAASAGKPDAARLALVKKVEIPSSGNEQQDAYDYGFRLWSAKLYPEAQAQLKTVVAKWPKSSQASYAQNLLGRAYLDSGAPSLAAVAFYENYKKNPKGERAPDSLYYLAQALIKLKKPAAEVCKVYTELDQLYGDKLSIEMKTGVAEGRASQKCK